MNKDSLIGNSLIFIVSAIMIYLSVVYLGRDNLMVGITGLFLLIAIVNKDFSRTPVRAIFKITFLTVFIGIVPFLVNLNMYTGIFINFIAVFIMIYLVVYTLNKSIYFPFLFGYTLLLTTNVTGHALGLRIFGLALVGIVAVVFQIVYTKFTTRHMDKNKNLNQIIDALILNINNFSGGVISEKDFDRFKDLSTIWSRDILEKRNNSFYLKDKENIELDLIATLDQIGNISKDFAHKIKNGDEKSKFLLIDANILLGKLKGFLNADHAIDLLDKEIHRLEKTYNENNENAEFYEFLESIKVIDKLTDKLLEVEKSKTKVKILTLNEWKDEIKLVKKYLVGDFNSSSVRFIFAFRTALLIAVAYFIIRFLNVPIGKWAIFTITSVSQPYNNTVRNRAGGRMIGTLVGVLIYLPLSMIFTSVEARIVIISIAVYFMISFKRYAYSTSMLTVLFVGVVTIDVKNILVYAQDRVEFIAIGIIAVLIGNKLIFPYSLEKETKILIKKYYNLSVEILDKTMKLYTKKGTREEIRREIIEAKGLENKIILNNTALNSDLLRSFRNEERTFLSKMHTTLNRIDYADNALKKNGFFRVANIEKMTKELFAIPIENSDELFNILKKYIKDIDKTSERLIYLEMYEMVKSLRKSEVLMKELTC
ncbi:MAG: FUSC family protein [Sarcina sp.]